METLHQQVRRARHRLIWQSFAGKLAWCWFATLLLAVAAIGAGKFFAQLDQNAWAIGSLAMALVLGALAAAVWTWARAHDRVAAAVEIDRRFELKERVASSLALDERQLQTPAGQALVCDAQRRIASIDVAERFGLRLGRGALLPLGPAAAAILLGLLVEARAPQAPAATTATAQIKKSTQTLAKKLEQQRKQAAEKGLAEIDSLLKQLGDETKHLIDKSPADRKQALIALNALTKNAEQRRQQLAQGAELRQQLSQLKNLQSGPAEKLAKALKNGDLPGAVKELAKLQEQLEGKLDAAAKQQLAQQIEQLQNGLEKKVAAQQQAREELKQQIDEQRRQGNLAQADKLAQQLDKLANKQAQMDAMERMADQLKQAAAAIKQGNDKQAAESLETLGEQLAGMQQEMQELETLDSALAEVADCKNAMACQQCDGQGCDACQGNDFKLNGQSARFSRRPGNGSGFGLPEDKPDTALYDSRVKQHANKGESIVVGDADGPNRKGQVREEIKGQFSHAQQQTSEALSGQKLPHEYRDHAKKYFDALREGQRE